MPALDRGKDQKEIFPFAATHDFISLFSTVRDVCRCDCISSVLAPPGSPGIEFFHLRLLNVI